METARSTDDKEQEVMGFIVFWVFFPPKHVKVLEVLATGLED